MQIEELKKGSPEAFKALVEQHSHDIISTCCSFVNSREDAEDVAQEVFIEVYKSIRQFNKEANLNTWIYRICINKSLDFLRKQHKRRSEIVPPGGGDFVSRLVSDRNKYYSLQLLLSSVVLFLTGINSPFCHV